MNDTTAILIGALAGLIGTGAGGIAAILIKNISDNLLCFMLQFAAGIMLCIVCIELIPEAIMLCGMATSTIGIIIGSVTIYIIDGAVKKMNVVKNAIASKSILKTGILVAIGLALHNLPEGLAVGTGLSTSIVFGINIALVIMLHDIPEGMSIALPLKVSGISNNRIFWITILSGLPTGIGAIFGIILSNISVLLVGPCLAIAAGAMIYIVSNELIPQSKKLYSPLKGIGFIVGVFVGILISFI